MPGNKPGCIIGNRMVPPLYPAVIHIVRRCHLYFRAKSLETLVSRQGLQHAPATVRASVLWRMQQQGKGP
jgi:hypothetical protein